MDRVHLRNVDLNLLLLFDALMEERHVTRAGQTVPSTMDFLPLLHDELVCLIRRDHPQAGVPLDMAPFLALHHVEIAQSPVDMRFIDGQLADQGVARAIALTVEDWLAVPHIVAGSDLLAVMPRSIAERYTDTCAIVLVPVPFGQHHLTWCL
jgi:DNA-binding transcriptional LysR family regulator